MRQGSKSSAGKGLVALDSGEDDVEEVESEGEAATDLVARARSSMDRGSAPAFARDVADSAVDYAHISALQEELLTHSLFDGDWGEEAARHKG